MHSGAASDALSSATHLKFMKDDDGLPPALAVIVKLWDKVNADLSEAAPTKDPTPASGPFPSFPEAPEDPDQVLAGVFHHLLALNRDLLNPGLDIGLHGNAAWEHLPRVPDLDPEDREGFVARDESELGL